MVEAVAPIVAGETMNSRLAIRAEPDLQGTVAGRVARPGTQNSAADEIAIEHSRRVGCTHDRASPTILEMQPSSTAICFAESMLLGRNRTCTRIEAAEILLPGRQATADAHLCEPLRMLGWRDIAPADRLPRHGGGVGAAEDLREIMKIEAGPL